MIAPSQQLDLQSKVFITKEQSEREVIQAILHTGIVFLQFAVEPTCLDSCLTALGQSV